jgi:hypothetical protein
VRVGIAYSSKDRVDKTKRTLKPLIQSPADVWWFDGSQNEEGKAYQEKFSDKVHTAVRLTGGSCRYIVCALTSLLDYGREDGGAYDYIGLVENDVMLHDGWFDKTMALFDYGKQAGLEVGAVSARCYVDRVLVQCDGFAVMHNLGAGMVIFSRAAAEIVLRYYRTGMTSENRKTFAMLSGVDIGPYWAFRGSDHMLVADWQYDRMLAQHGLCSLALTPAKASQLENIKSMGLEMAKKEVKERRDKAALARYTESLAAIRKGRVETPTTPGMRLFHSGTWTIFPHQIRGLGGTYSGHWRFKWALGYGCFAWKSGANCVDHGPEGFEMWTAPPIVDMPISGPVDVLVSGGEAGGQVRVEDEDSNFSCEPVAKPEGEAGILNISVPGSVAYRNVRVTALTPGVIFYGIRTREPQPYLPHIKFDSTFLPPL